ncbi:hypothetical protein GCM10017687_15190 [Streptomyces echinatus]
MLPRSESGPGLRIGGELIIPHQRWYADRLALLVVLGENGIALGIGDLGSGLRLGRAREPKEPTDQCGA